MYILNWLISDYAVPQGSVLGPVMFTVYTSPLRDVILEHDVQYNFYADDTQLYLKALVNIVFDRFKKS